MQKQTGMVPFGSSVHDKPPPNGVVVDVFALDWSTNQRPVNWNWSEHTMKTKETVVAKQH